MDIETGMYLICVRKKFIVSVSLFPLLISVSPFAMIAFLSADSCLHHHPSIYISIGFTRGFRMVIYKYFIKIIPSRKTIFVLTKKVEVK